MGGEYADILGTQELGGGQRFKWRVRRGRYTGEGGRRGEGQKAEGGRGSFILKNKIYEKEKGSRKRGGRKGRPLEEKKKF